VVPFFRRFFGMLDSLGSGWYNSSLPVATSPGEVAPKGEHFESYIEVRRLRSKGTERVSVC